VFPSVSVSGNYPLSQIAFRSVSVVALLIGTMLNYSSHLLRPPASVLLSYFIIVLNTHCAARLLQRFSRRRVHDDVQLALPVRNSEVVLFQIQRLAPVLPDGLLMPYGP